MAVDEHLMNLQKKEETLPTLRIYFWKKSAYSLGYFQNIKKFLERNSVRNSQAEIVRRITGGGMVFHENDLTFSFTSKDPTIFLPSAVRASYQRVNEAVYEGLKEIISGISFSQNKIQPSGRAHEAQACFENPSCYDLMLAGKKILGASQRRSAGVLLHQATLFLSLDRERLIKEIVRGFEKSWGAVFNAVPLSDAELLEARQIEKFRYASSEWAVNQDRITS